MASAVAQLLHAPMRLIPLLVLLACLPLAWGRVDSALQSNRAFVGANHLPSLFTKDGDASALADVEVRLRNVQASGASRRSVQRMLALVSRARLGRATPPAAFSAAELTWWARQKQLLGDVSAARYLLEWAAGQESELGDAWYYLGRLHHQEQRPQAARDALRRAAAATVWHDLGRSDAYLALGDVYGDASAGLDVDAAMENYEEALQLDHFGATEHRARAHYALAELLLWHKGDAAAAAPHYAATVALTPENHWARLRLGYSYYWADGDLERAEREIMNAIAAWPGEKYLQWPYYYLGEIYEHAGLSSEAANAYDQVLALDPADDRTRLRLSNLRGP